jgi:hypothetical protein
MESSYLPVLIGAAKPRVDAKKEGISSFEGSGLESR